MCTDVKMLTENEDKMGRRPNPLYKRGEKVNRNKSKGIFKIRFFLNSLMSLFVIAIHSVKNMDSLNFIAI